MGHSNGGSITLWYAIYGTHRDRLAGVVLGSPLLSLHPHVRPWGITVAAGKLAAKLFPTLQLVNKLDPKTMSRDKEVCRKFDEDELCHDTGTLLGISEMLGRGKTLQKAECYGKYNESLPLCIAHGTGDMVCSAIPLIIFIPLGHGNVAKTASPNRLHAIKARKSSLKMSMLKIRHSFLMMDGIINVRDTHSSYLLLYCN